MARCHVCDKAMALGTLKPTDGEVHDVRVHIERMPVMECPEGHRRFVAPDFAIQLMEALLEGDRLLPIDPASRRGLLRKRYCCPGCGTELEGGPDRRVHASRVLELNGLEAFDIDVELPKLACSACRREYVPPSEIVVEDLMKASARAFRAAAVSTN
jgi:hypothetical protein